MHREAKSVLLYLSVITLSSKTLYRLLYASSVHMEYPGDLGYCIFKNVQPIEHYNSRLDRIIMYPTKQFEFQCDY